MLYVYVQTCTDMISKHMNYEKPGSELLASAPDQEFHGALTSKYGGFSNKTWS